MQRGADGRVTTWETVSVVGEPVPGTTRVLEQAYFAGIGKVRGDDEGLTVHVLGVPLVRLGKARVTVGSGSEVRSRPLLGGLLARPGGELQVMSEAARDKTARVTIKLEGFSPRLSRLVYRWLQGPVHQAYTRHFLGTLATNLGGSSLGRG